MLPSTEKLVEHLAQGSEEERYIAAQEIYYLPETELSTCFEALCGALSDTGMWMQYTTDDWGGYLDIENRPAVLIAQALGKIGNPAAFLPLLESLALPHHEDVLMWIGRAMEALPLPEYSHKLENNLIEAIKRPNAPREIRNILQKLVTTGKSWREVMELLDHSQMIFRGIALSQISEMHIKGDEQRKLVAQLRAYLRCENVWNSTGIIYTIREHATVEEMVDAILDDFLNRPDLIKTITDEMIPEIGHALNILGYGMGYRSAKAIGRMCEILSQVKNRLAHKELATWYSCLVKITNEPPVEIVADMIELYEKAHEWVKDYQLTDLKYVFSGEEILLPFFRRHQHDKTRALGDTTTLGQRIKEIMSDRKILVL